MRRVRRLYRAQIAALVQEQVGNEGDADAIRRNAIREFFGMEIGAAWPQEMPESALEALRSELQEDPANDR